MTHRRLCRASNIKLNSNNWSSTFISTILGCLTFGQVFDILWSDPQHNEGCQPNGLRGAGTYFGPDVTQKFLRKYKLVFLVRSHECKHEGYEIMHNGKVIEIPFILFCFSPFDSVGIAVGWTVHATFSWNYTFFLRCTLRLFRFLQVITIFSASNYYEIGNIVLAKIYVDSTKLIKLGHWFAGSNKGAYLKLNPQLDTHFVQYTAAASKTRKLTFRQRVGLVESSALRELGARLRERRNELEREFNARDPGATGKNNYFSSMFPLPPCCSNPAVHQFGFSLRIPREPQTQSCGAPEHCTSLISAGVLQTVLWD